MKNDQYRTQLEEQVKDLIAQYLQTHGEAPAVTIEWGKVAPAAPEPEVVPPDEWNPASEPPDNDRWVNIVLNNGKNLQGWHSTNSKKWSVLYEDASDVFAGDWIRDGHVVIGWQDISKIYSYNSENSNSIYSWHPKSVNTMFDGEYLCILEVHEECGAIKTTPKVVENKMNKWVLRENEILLFWKHIERCSKYDSNGPSSCPM